MFPLPQSDRPNVASQKSLGQNSGHHWIPGIETAGMVAVIALDYGRTLRSRQISWRTRLGKPMGPRCTGEQVFASLRSSQCPMAIHGMGSVVSGHGEVVSMERW